jgi:hypothetical protein
VARRFAAVRFFRDERELAARFLRFAICLPPGLSAGEESIKDSLLTKTEASRRSDRRNLIRPLGISVAELTNARL